ncbi:MAG TPA: hypothetical protein GXZ98_05660 [Firmicutes bacterium]|nr:hypothetical protein [Bacillota bacterium]
MRKVLIVLFLIMGGLLAATQVLAVEAGGKAELFYRGTWFESGAFTDELKDHLELELDLPSLGKTEFSYAFRIDHPLQGLTAGKEASYFTKKLYVKHRFPRFHLTVGRQPVSWSFGSLLNPVDYTIGAEALEKENDSKFTDAVEAYIPLNWNSSLALVASFPTGFDFKAEKMKWGVRGRFGVKGYDLTLNYMQEPAAGPGGQGQGQGIPRLPGVAPLPRRRAGFTFKGDLGDLGVYGAFGHYFGGAGESGNSYLIGADYSYNVGYYSKLTMQMEYLLLDGSNLSQLLGQFITLGCDGERTNLLTCTLAYPIDDFSAVSLTTITNPGGGKYLVIPRYQNTLPGNIDLELNLLLSLSDDPPKTTSIAMRLSYPF